MSQKIAIYTVIVGNYDSPKDPVNLPDDFSWTCIRPDSNQLQSLGISNPKIASVYYKTHPEELFPDSEWSLFVDGNINIIDEQFYSAVRNLVAQDTLYAGIRHPQRDDIFDESWRIIRNGRDTLRNMRRVTRFLKKEGMPRHFGLTETNVVLRKHSNPKVAEFDKLWWETYSCYPQRDQMTQSYCIWKTGLDVKYLLPEGYSARNSSLFEYTMHGKDAQQKDRSIKGRYRDALRALLKIIFRIHLTIIGRPITNID